MTAPPPTVRSMLRLLSDVLDAENVEVRVSPTSVVLVVTTAEDGPDGPSTRQVRLDTDRTEWARRALPDVDPVILALVRFYWGRVLERQEPDRRTDLRSLAKFLGAYVEAEDKGNPFEGLSTLFPSPPDPPRRQHFDHLHFDFGAGAQSRIFGGSVA